MCIQVFNIGVVATSFELVYVLTEVISLFILFIRASILPALAGSTYIPKPSKSTVAATKKAAERKKQRTKQQVIVEVHQQDQLNFHMHHYYLFVVVVLDIPPTFSHHYQKHQIK